MRWVGAGVDQQLNHRGHAQQAQRRQARGQAEQKAQRKHMLAQGGQGGGQSAGQGRQGGGQGQGQGPILVVTAAARMANIDVGIEAIGTAVSNEAVSITAKVSNIVTAIHFKDGQNVKAGDVLVEMDHAQVTAELASAQADYANSVLGFGDVTIAYTPANKPYAITLGNFDTLSGMEQISSSRWSSFIERGQINDAFINTL